jgi:hypothetical protein
VTSRPALEQEQYTTPRTRMNPQQLGVSGSGQAGAQQHNLVGLGYKRCNYSTLRCCEINFLSQGAIFGRRLTKKNTDWELPAIQRT